MRRAVLLPMLALGACVMGPDYDRPAPPARSEAAFKSSVNGLATPDDLPDRWWTLYDDANVDRLVRAAFAANTDLRQAIARLEQARAVLAEARANYIPVTQASGGVRYRRGAINGAGAADISGSGIGSGNANTAQGATPRADTIYSAGFDVAWELDLFGRIRRSVEAARADADAQAAAADYVRVTVAAETTRAYVGACSAAEQLAVARSSLQIAQGQLAIARRQYALGALAQDDVDRLAALAEQAAAALPTIENDRRASLFNLALLTGKAPADIDAAADRCTRPPALTRRIPVGDGRALLARRPDVRQAERTLAADTARIGVATADLYPRISLGGSIASIGTGLSSMTSREGVSFALGPLISWTFPNVAITRARIAQARGQAEISLAAFDGTILTALNETERALTAYATESDRNAALRRALAAQENAYRVAQARARFGAVSPISLLDTERTLIQARTDLAASDTLLNDRAVSVFKALGGGWR